ncbi:MAG TPA: magnesium transporter CorA family protein [Phaeodactylibacter sp.]|nr:magnesium transporter CorA family protein [Phaeodactylibacter sp.]
MIEYYSKKGSELLMLTEPEAGCWINIEPPFSREELQDLAEAHGIPLDFFTDSLDVDERSRYETEDGVRLIVVNTPLLNEVDEEEVDAIFITVPIGIILTEEHLFTISSHPNPVIERFQTNKVKNFDPHDHKLFVLQIFQQTVFRYLSCLKQLNRKSNIIEQKLYDSSRNKELMQLLSIEKSYVYFINSLSSNELLKMKIKRTDYLGIGRDEDLVDLFEDIIIDNSQALEMANVYSNILNGTMDAYTSIISNNLNIVMQRLTLITIILMVPTLVASFYGMNVDLPLQENPYAFILLILISLLMSVALAIYFQKRRLF